jgi:hypothetical protein
LPGMYEALGVIPSTAGEKHLNKLRGEDTQIVNST